MRQLKGEGGHKPWKVEKHWFEQLSSSIDRQVMTGQSSSPYIGFCRP